MIDWKPIADMPESVKASERRVWLYGPTGGDVGRWAPHWGEAGMWVRDFTAEYDNDYAPIQSPTHYAEITPPGDTP